MLGGGVGRAEKCAPLPGSDVRLLPTATATGSPSSLPSLVRARLPERDAMHIPTGLVFFFLRAPSFSF